MINGGHGVGHLGQMPPPPPPPPCGGAILLTKILNFVKPRSAYKIHENMYILLAFIANSPETKVNQNQTNYEIVTQHLRVRTKRL